MNGLDVTGGMALRNSVQLEPGRLRAGVLAVVVHIVFFAFMIFGLNWKTSPPESMTVDLWSSLPPPPPPVQPAAQGSAPGTRTKPSSRLPKQSRCHPSRSATAPAEARYCSQGKNRKTQAGKEAGGEKAAAEERKGTKGAGGEGMKGKSRRKRSRKRKS